MGTAEERGASPAQVFREEDVKVKEFDLSYELGVDCNPVTVFDDVGRVIGTAVVSLERGSLKLHFYLDPHNPDVFDMEVDPKRVRVSFQGGIFDNRLRGGVVWLESK